MSFVALAELRDKLLEDIHMVSISRGVSRDSDDLIKGITNLGRNYKVLIQTVGDCRISSQFPMLSDGENTDKDLPGSVQVTNLRSQNYLILNQKIIYIQFAEVENRSSFDSPVPMRGSGASMAG